jgi:hypothetical protein
MLLLALDWGGVSYPWSSATIIGLFCGAAGTFCLLLGWEFHQGETAMLPLSLFRNSIVSCAAIANIMSNGAFFLVTYYLPIWFQVVKDASPMMSGVYTLPSVLSQIVGTVATGFLGMYIQPLPDPSEAPFILTFHSLKNRLLHPIHHCRGCHGSNRIRSHEHFHAILCNGSLGLLSAHERHFPRHDNATTHHSGPSQPPKKPTCHRHGPHRFLPEPRRFFVRLTRTNEL